MYYSCRKGFTSKSAKKHQQIVHATGDLNEMKLTFGSCEA